MKSKVQSYDLRDSHEYYGVFELQRMLHDTRDSSKVDYKMIKKCEDLQIHVSGMTSSFGTDDDDFDDVIEQDVKDRNRRSDR